MPTSRSQKHIARFTTPFGATPPTVHCVLCGQPTYDSEAEDFAPCRHLLFVFCHWLGEFVYSTPEFDELLERYNEQQDGCVPFSQVCEEIDLGEHTLLLELTHGGMACGPVWYTDTYAFDFSVQESEQDPAQA